MKTWIKAFKSIRKPIAPAVRIERPLKGRGYRRPQNQKEVYGEE